MKLHSRLLDRHFAGTVMGAGNGKWMIAGLIACLLSGCVSAPAPRPFSAKDAVGAWRSARVSEGLLFKTRWHYEFEIVSEKGEPRLKEELRTLSEGEQAGANNSAHVMTFGLFTLFSAFGSAGGPPELIQRWDAPALTLRIIERETRRGRTTERPYAIQFQGANRAVLFVSGRRLAAWKTTEPKG